MELYSITIRSYMIEKIIMKIYRWVNKKPEPKFKLIRGGKYYVS